MPENQDRKILDSLKEKARERGTGTDSSSHATPTHDTDSIHREGITIINEEAKKNELSTDSIALTKKRLRIYDAMDMLLEILVLLTVYLIIQYCLVSPFVVNGASMESTLHNQEVILVDRIGFSKILPIQPSLKEGDVVVFKPPINVEEYYIKRIIGVPGDKVAFKNNSVYVNDKKLDEPYTNCLKASENSTFVSDKPKCSYEREEKAYTELTVPENTYFVMGDNRERSSDSRSCFTGSFVKDCPVGSSHFVPKENIVGKAWVVIWPWNKDAALGRTGSFFESFAPINNPRSIESFTYDEQSE